MHEFLIARGWNVIRHFGNEYRKTGPDHYKNRMLELSGSIEKDKWINICYCVEADNGFSTRYHEYDTYTNIYDGPCSSVEQLEQILKLLQI